MLINELKLSNTNIMLEKLKSIADDLLINNKKFVIWGCGYTGRSTYDFIEKHTNGRLKPVYFVDNNQSYWGENNVVGPEVFARDMEKIDVVIVGVYVADQVHNQLIQMNYKGEIFWSSMSATCVDEATINMYNNNMEKIKKIYDLLDDERSKETLEVYLDFVQNGDIDLWKGVNGNSIFKLIDQDVIDCSCNHDYVDVGAFIGDTLDAFIKCSNGKYNSVLCIEPDEKNFNQLKKYVNENNIVKATLKNVAAGIESGETTFNSDCSESCYIDSNGAKKIKMVALDDVLEAQNATYIKISTNGYDLNTLKGAKNIIAKNKPQIATYASGSQLWDIPLYLKMLVPEYKIYFRHYGIGRQAMICYARL